MADVKRRKNESFEGLFRRFTRRVQQGGCILQARKYRYRIKDMNKTKERESAIRRLKMGEKREYLIRTGKLVEDRRRRRRRF